MSKRINLLEWRRERREARQKQFKNLVALAMIGGGLVGVLTNVIVGRMVDNQTQRNDYLRQQIAIIDQQIKEIQELEKVRARLVSRMQVIQELQTSRSATVHFFDELVNTLPEGVNLVSVRQTGAGAVIDGTAESNSRVSSYMKNLDASPWFADPQLVVIKTGEKNNTRQSDFTLQVKNLTKAQPDGAAGADKGVYE